MADDAHEISEYLVRENGQEKAEQIAFESAMEAQESGNNYELSIWREVKRILREMRGG